VRTAVTVPIYVPVTVMTRILLRMSQLETPAAESSTGVPNLPFILGGVTGSCLVVVGVGCVVRAVLKARAEMTPQDIQDATTGEGNTNRRNGGNRPRDGDQNPLAEAGFVVREDDIENMLYRGRGGEGAAGVENRHPEHLP
jgi:hypothetical protein